MKPKRTILCVEHPSEASVLRVLLQTHGYRVLTCENEAEALAAAFLNPVDLVVVGAHAKFDESWEGRVPIATLRMWHAMAPDQFLERIRIALVRKRGPKPPTIEGMKERYARFRGLHE